MKFVRAHRLTEDPIQYNIGIIILLYHNKKKESFSRQGQYH